MKLLLEVLFLILTILCGAASILAIGTFVYHIIFDGGLEDMQESLFIAALVMIPIVAWFISRYILNYIKEKD